MTDVRAATPADLPAIRSIQTAALEEPWPELLELAVGGAAAALVAEIDDAVVGYAIAVGAPEEPAYLPELAVHPDRQREGHGTALLETTCDRLGAAGHPQVRLAARAEDDAVRRFYEHLDFAVVERLPAEYETGDGLLLTRSLETDG